VKTFALATLGCKVNQVDSERLRRGLVAAGLREVDFGEAADVAIVNTCTVTAHADRECRALLLRARRASSSGIVVLAGCLVDRGAEGRARGAGADLLVGNDEKDGLVDRVLETVGERATSRATDVPPAFLGRARAFLKVQDGCDAACAYCIVPRVRGASRSVPAGAVIAEACAYAAAGFRELVLTGIHLGDWGKGLPGSPSLVDLCRAIERAVPVRRLRLSSIEPGEVTDDLLAWLRDSPVACPHLHVPLQSGDADTLRRMNRSYTPNDYRALVGRVRERLPDACLGADVLVGFPGETDDGFARTLRFLADLPVDYLHVFPFSPRPGTPAAALAGQVDGRVARARASELRRVSAEKRAVFAERFVGRRVEVLVENVEDRDGRPVAIGLTRNYLRVAVRGASCVPGEVRTAVVVTAGPRGGEAAATAD
jgi:threonylcarbamoyladenosine tRNA methylthiotransferase MtaB